MNMEKTLIHKLWSMKLHESIICYVMGQDGEGAYEINILRVPGGWIYGWNTKTSRFIPLNNEHVF